MEVESYITEIRQGEGFYTFTPFADTRLLERRAITSVNTLIDDGRSITNEQRRKIFALVGDIVEWMTAPAAGKRTKAEKEALRELHLLYLLGTLDGHEDAEDVRRQLMLNYCRILDMAPFSLSDVDRTTARGFIDWMVELCVMQGIPCQDTLLNACEDDARYLYACVANRRCAICGKKAEIHEVEKVGMGNNRKKMHHLGQLVQPLCRAHHYEQENIGQGDFNRKHHLPDGIRLDENLCKIIGWRK